MLARALHKFAPGLVLDARAGAAMACTAAAAVVVSILVAPDAGGAAAAGLALIMVAIAVVDARRFIIPDELSVAGFALGLVHAGLAGDPVVEAVALAALRGLVLALVFLALREIYARLRGRQGIGLGDVKLAGVAGAWLDWQMMPVAVEIAAVAALAVYLMRQLVLGRSIRSTSMLPFGLFFAPAIWLGWVLQVLLLAP